jgi:hypothetical protein
VHFGSPHLSHHPSGDRRFRRVYIRDCVGINELVCVYSNGQTSEMLFEEGKRLPKVFVMIAFNKKLPDEISYIPSSRARIYLGNCKTVCTAQHLSKLS